MEDSRDISKIRRRLLYKVGYRFDRETGKFLGQEVNGKLYKSGEMAPAWNPIKGKLFERSDRA